MELARYVYLHSLRRFGRPEFEHQRERFAKGMIENIKPSLKC